MQAVVKTPHIKVEGRNIPDDVISFLREKYGEVDVITEEDDEIVEISKSRWYKNIRTKITAGNNIRFYREMRGWTQAELGARLGNVPKQNISNMENGRRPISKDMGKRLAALFEVRVEKFIE